jgi:hypothetical protein
MISAAVGGLASVAGGGKFANGAVTAAFGYLLNSANHANDDGGGIRRLWDDLLDVVGHNARVYLLALDLWASGYTVAVEVRLQALGQTVRADIMYQRSDDACTCGSDWGIGKWGIIDVKTPEYPNYSYGQEIVYRAFNVGGASSDAERITVFGYQQNQLLPAGWVWQVGPGMNFTVWPPFSFPRPPIR